jgi:hypothetical protein
MKRLIALLLLVPFAASAAFTEFYVQTTANNLNSGSTTSDSATYTGVGDSDGTSVFTPSDGSTPASSVNVGDWASVYVTSGATVATFVGRVTVVAAGVNGAITVSTAAKAGAFPASSAGAHTISCKVGGAWAGPSGAVGFPFGFAAGTLTNASSDVTCVNIKGGTTYSITAGMTQSAADNLTVMMFSGYTGSVRDGGRAKIDGGTTGASYALLTVTGKNATYQDLEFQNNGATGNQPLVNSSTGSEDLFYRCVFHDSMGNGITVNGVCTVNQCEAYACDKSNTADFGGFVLQSSGADAINCISHHNQTNNAAGFKMDGGIHLINCVSFANGYGVRSTADVLQSIINCDFYANTNAGIHLNSGASDPLVVLIRNCNLLKNGTWGIQFGNGAFRNGLIQNCGFGTGTQANGSGDISTQAGFLVSGTVNYASGVTPWVAPSTGDFRITLATAKNAGIGSYLQTYTGSTWTGTIGYPDIGAAQHLDSGGGERSYTFAQ